MKSFPSDMSLGIMADVARAHGGDGGGEDPSRPPPTSFGCAGCFINRGKGKRKPNLGGVKAGRKTRERTRNQVLKDAVAANKGRPIEIGFEDRADNTVVPTGPYSTQWGNYFGEMIRSIPLYYPSWQSLSITFERMMRSESDANNRLIHSAQFGKSYKHQRGNHEKDAHDPKQIWPEAVQSTVDSEVLVGEGLVTSLQKLTRHGPEAGKLADHNPIVGTGKARILRSSCALIPAHHDNESRDFRFALLQLDLGTRTTGRDGFCSVVDSGAEPARVRALYCDRRMVMIAGGEDVWR
ncbi:hypothetical protein Tco_0970590 [Tanacetum coccineum]